MEVGQYGCTVRQRVNTAAVLKAVLSAKSWQTRIQMVALSIDISRTYVSTPWSLIKDQLKVKITENVESYD